jgi:lipopolysaccharide transport system permease protein
VIRNLWRYRHFVLGGVRRELTLRYSGSLLGGAWQLIGPAVTIAIFTVVFSEVMRARLPGTGDRFGYAIFVCAGIAGWTLFSEIVGRSQRVFLDNANLIKKAPFPRGTLLAIQAIASLVGFTVFVGLVLALLALLGRWPGWPLLAVVPLAAVLAGLAVALGLIAAVLNVFFKDIGQAIPLVLQFWFWLTPIVYPASILPPAWRHWLALNPLTPVFVGLQEVFVAGRWPDTAPLVVPLALMVAAMAFALLLYRRAAPELADEL